MSSCKGCFVLKIGADTLGTDGRGIAWAPACGKAMAELILDGESKCVDISPFDPSRFTPAAQRGQRGRKRQGASVGEQW